ncbi:MAG: 1-acyl-sn-glycerol-3-phosphate acyltransferase [Rhodothermales bacterium]|jgi:1-acyl-sn-glycerol-3-phosphate acyltransferase
MTNWRYQTAADHGLPAFRGLASPMRESGLPQWFLQHLTWNALAAYMRLRHQFTVKRAEPLPRTPFILVANHCSHLDALALGVAMDWYLRGDLRFLAARDTFFDTPLHSMFAAAMLNALPLERSSRGGRTVLALREQLQTGDLGLVLFPEGTRSRSGEMGTFRPGIGMLTAGTSIPVIPCHISGTFGAWPSQRALPGEGGVSLQIGSAQHFLDVPNSRHGWRTIAETLETKVRQLGNTEKRSP